MTPSASPSSASSSPAAETCVCGRSNRPLDLAVHIGPGALEALPEALAALGAERVTLLFDPVTYGFLGDRLRSVLRSEPFTVATVVLGSQERPFEPDHQGVRLALAQDPHPSVIVGVGSGAINDLGKYAAWEAGSKYVCVATAPSMDGFAAPISALVVDGVKTTYDTMRPHAIIGDVDILASAPPRLIAAGFGDIAGKLTSCRDWEMARSLLDEAFCHIAQGEVIALAEEVMARAGKLASGDREAVGALMRALVETGYAVAHVGNSRPTSGSEHLVSHFFEMGSANRGRRPPVHGHVVGVATLLVCEVAAVLGEMEAADLPVEAPPIEREPAQVLEGLALARVPDNFGSSKFDPAVRTERLQRLRARWDELRPIFHRIPRPETLAAALSAAGCPTRLSELTDDEALASKALTDARYLRERYTLWDVAADVGILPDLARRLYDRHR